MHLLFGVSLNMSVRHPQKREIRNVRSGLFSELIVQVLCIKIETKSTLSENVYLS